MCRVEKNMASVHRFSCVCLVLLLAGVSSASYLGKRIGKLSELEHLVSGEVFAVDSRTLHIKGFTYDGAAPDAFFFAGTSGRPSNNGFVIPDENGSTKPLRAYNRKDVTLTLPEGVTLKDIKWLSIWCKQYSIDFGNLMMPNNLQYPRPQKIDAFPNLSHDVTSDRIVVVDAQTFLIPNFSYDGLAPGGYNTKSSTLSNRNRNNNRYRDESRERSDSSSRHDDDSSESVFSRGSQYRPPNSFARSSYTSRHESRVSRKQSTSKTSSSSSRQQNSNYNSRNFNRGGGNFQHSYTRPQHNSPRPKPTSSSYSQNNDNNNSRGNGDSGARALALKHFGR